MGKIVVETNEGWRCKSCYSIRAVINTFWAQTIHLRSLLSAVSSNSSSCSIWTQTPFRIRTYPFPIDYSSQFPNSWHKRFSRIRHRNLTHKLFSPFGISRRHNMSGGFFRVSSSQTVEFTISIIHLIFVTMNRYLIISQILFVTLIW